MSGFDEIQFPNDIAYGAEGGAQFSTQITELWGGREARNQNWPTARGKWDVSTGLKDPSDLATLNAFFRARRGRAIGFRFKDWADFSTTAEEIGVGDHTQVAYQLTKTYTSGPSSYVRNIYKPVAGTINIYLNSVLQVSGYTVDTTTGIVTFTVAPGDGVIITADFEFDVPCRFDTDWLNVTMEFFNTAQWHAVTIVEILDLS